MSNSKERIRELLALTNETLVSNWVQLASLIKNYENLDWKSSKKQALELLNDGNALDYIDVVRNEYSQKRSTKPKSKQPSKSKSKKAKAKVVPLNSKRDRLSMNYKYLVQLIPDLIDRLENGEEIYGKSQLTGYMDFNVELIHKDRTGYYLAISHYYIQNGDSVADPDMQILVDPKSQTVQALEFQNSLYYRKVYDDTYNRKMVNTKEKQSQNAFLNDWLKNLINQGHQVEWRHLDKERNRNSQSSAKASNKKAASDKPDISYMEESVIQEIKDSIAKKSLDQIKLDYKDWVNMKMNVKILPLHMHFIIERLHDEVPDFNAPYLDEEALREHYDMLLSNSEGKSGGSDETKSLGKSDKPDISFMDDALISSIKQRVQKKKMEVVGADYISMVKGAKEFDSIEAYFMAERINEGKFGFNVPYPKEELLKEDYAKLIAPKPEEDNSVTPDASVEDDMETVFTSNYEKLLKLVPGLSIKMNAIRNAPEKGKVFRSTSKKKKLLYDLIVKLSYRDDYEASLFIVEKDEDDHKSTSAMRVLVNNKSKTVRALSMRSPEGKPIYVYSNEKDFQVASETELKDQNEFLGKWLDELIRKEHKVKDWKKQEIESDVVDEYSKVDPDSKKVDSNEREKTAKYWTKLAAFIELNERISSKEAKEKALKLKQEGTALDYLDEVEEAKRVALLNRNDLVRRNFNKLLVLIPELLNHKSEMIELQSQDGSKIIEVRKSQGKHTNEIKLQIEEKFDKYTSWNLWIWQSEKKVFVETRTSLGKHKLSSSLDAYLEQWLDGILDEGFTPKKNDQNSNESEAVAKHLAKLAAFIEKTEGLNKKQAKKKAIKLKEDGKAENYVAQNFNRQKTVNLNQLQKTNYQKLLRLLPDLMNLEVEKQHRYISKKGRLFLDVTIIKKQGSFGKQINLFEHGDKAHSWDIAVQKAVKKVSLQSYVVDQKEQELEQADKEFSKWLDKMISVGYSRAEKTIKELHKKHPIIIEYAEGSNDSNVGFDSLEKLHDRLKKYDVPKSRQYTKVKVWFKGYPEYVRIDLSESKGNFDPNNKSSDLEDWLEKHDPKFDWFKFSQETDKKKLQKKADRVPQMEVGKVKLTKEHKRAGLTQKHINWINRHKQGMVITPIKKMTNNTKSFGKDLQFQAKRAGKRISKTGRIYYETRSNRSDMTNAGL